jgi:hypothetical protein
VKFQEGDRNVKDYIIDRLKKVHKREVAGCRCSRASTGGVTLGCAVLRCARL